MRIPKEITAFIHARRVAHLATADAGGQPLVIPICFAFDGKEFFSPIDEKPKQISPHKLKRLRNITENPKISLIIDRYDEDWQRLAYLLITGRAKILLRGARHRRAVLLLREKYSQYERMAIDERPIIVITPIRIRSWGNL
jgi:coenzyme F420-0:L-glutamate ligase / coenzyme F420-1:gamma-L-glutamate ligase